MKPEDGLFEFVWSVCRDGYRYEERNVEEGIIPVVVKNSARFRNYRPLVEFPGLFRRLAHVPTEPGPIVEFANEFGLLWQESGDFDDYQFFVRSIFEMSYVVDAIDRGRHQDAQHIFNTPHFRPTFSIRLYALSGPRSQMKIQPLSLMAALWKQVAEEISTGTNFKKCKFCPMWFSYGPGTGRKNTKVFCSDRCRVAWNRQKKKEASK